MSRKSDRSRSSTILVSGFVLPFICLYVSGVSVAWFVDVGFSADTVVYVKAVLAWSIPTLLFGVCLGALDRERAVKLAVYCASMSVMVYIFLCVTGVYSADIFREFARDTADVAIRLILPVFGLALLVPAGAAAFIASRSWPIGNESRQSITSISATDLWQCLFPKGDRKFSLLIILAGLFAIAVNAHVGRHYYREAIGFSNDKLLDKAVDSYQFYLTIWPFDDRAHVSLGYVYEKLGRKEEALKEWRKAEALNPLSAAWALHSHFKTEKQTRATLLEAKRLGREDEVMQAYLAIAKEYEEAQDFESAVSTLREALGTDHKSVESWDIWIREGLAGDLSQLGRYKEQAAELEQIVSLSPEDSELRLALAAVYLNNRQFKEARQSLKRADEIDAKQANSPYGTDAPPRFPPGFKFIQVARIHSAAGERRKAIENLKLAVNAGCNCRDLIENEKDFDSLQTSQEFKRLLRQAHKGAER